LLKILLEVKGTALNAVLVPRIGGFWNPFFYYVTSSCGQNNEYLVYILAKLVETCKILTTYLLVLPLHFYKSFLAWLLCLIFIINTKAFKKDDKKASYTDILNVKVRIAPFHYFITKHLLFFCILCQNVRSSILFIIF